jgi:hypothetical protein
VVEACADTSKPFHVVVRRALDGHTSFYSGHDTFEEAAVLATVCNEKVGHHEGFPQGFTYAVESNTADPAETE